MSDEDIIDDGNNAVSTEPQQGTEPTTDAPDTGAPVDSSGPTADPSAAEPSPVPASEAATRRSQPPAGMKPDGSANPIPSQIDPVKALNDYRAQVGREQAQLKRELDDLRSFQAQARQKEREAQAQSEKLKLKRWDPQHPEHGNFRSMMAKRDALNKQFSNIDRRTDLTPELKEQLKGELQNASLSPQEQEELIDHHQMTREFLTNPVGASRAVAREEAQTLVREAFAQFQQWNQANSQVGNDLKGLPAAAQPIMAELLQQGNGYDVSIRLAKAEAELQALRGERSGATKMASHAAEQQRLAKSNATVTRDPRPADITPDTIYAEAKKLAAADNIGPAHPKFPKYYAKAEAKLQVL